MVKFLFRIIVLLLLIVGALLIAPQFIPADVYKPRIEAAASQALGRQVTMAGDMQFSFFPRLEILAEDVAVANVKGGTAPHLTKMDSLAIGVALRPLLERKIEVAHITLQKPSIHLEVDRAGNANWVFAEKKASPQSNNESKASSDGFFTIEDVSIDEIQIIDGALSYRAPKSTQDVKDINGRVSLSTLDAPLKAKGSLLYEQVNMSFDSVLELPRVLLDGGKSPLTFSMSSDLASADFKGNFHNDADTLPTLRGNMDVTAKSLSALLDALSTQKTSNPFGPFSAKGNIVATAERIAFRKATIKLDGMNAEGQLSLNYAGAIPDLRGKLRSKKLDFNKWVAPQKKAAANSSSNTGAGTGAKGQSAAQRTTWDTTPIDFTGLRDLNARLEFTSDALTFQDLKFGKNLLILTIKDALLRANLKELDLYKGGGKGFLEINAKGRQPRIRSEFSLSNLATLPFLKDALGLERIEGLGNITYSLTTSGNSEADWVRGLNGNANLKIVDGAWKGVNLAAMARSIQQFTKKKSDEDETGQGSVGNNEKTDFAELVSGFSIKNGIVTADRISLLNPYIRVTGGGTIDLPKDNVRIRLRPKIVDTSFGQGGESNLAGLSFPVIIEGPLANLSYRADVSGLIGEALTGGAEGEPEDILQGFIRKSVDDILNKDKKKQADPAADNSASEGGAESSDASTQTSPAQNNQNETEASEEEEPDPVKLLFDLLQGDKGEEN